MDQNQKCEPNLRLPEFLPKPGGQTAQDLSFVTNFEGDNQKGQHLADAAASGVNTERKVYRIRNKDLLVVLGNLPEIERITNAAVAIVENAESNVVGHSFIDLVGTDNQIRTAEQFILHIIIKKSYNISVFPVILMSPTIERERITMPLYKVGSLIGPNGSNIVKLEMESRTWIAIDDGPHDSLVVNVYGQPDNVIKAFSLIQSEIRQFCESSEVDIKIEELLKIKSEKYAKAKIEEPSLRLPKALLNSNTDPSSGDICYKHIFEEDNKKYQHLAKAVVAGAKADRKLYRIRDKELVKALGDNFEEIKNIHRVSISTVGLLTNPESSLVSQSFIELIGTEDQVKTAEQLILDIIIKAYNGLMFPTILMPPTVYWHKKKLPLNKINRLMGENGSNIVAMEIASGAWIELDKGPHPSGGSRLERLAHRYGPPRLDIFVHIYGPVANIVTALSFINSIIYEPGDSTDAEHELEQLSKEFMFDEMMCGMKPCFKVLEKNGSYQVEEA